MRSSFLDALEGKNKAALPFWFMRQAGVHIPEYKKLKESYSILEITRTPDLATSVVLSPLRYFRPDALILFADVILPLLALGIDIELDPMRGPIVSGSFKNAEDIESVGELTDPASFDYLTETIKNILRETKNRVPLIGFSGSPFLLSSYLCEGGASRTFDASRHLMQYSPLVWHSLMNKVTQAIIFYLKVQIKAGVHAIQLFDTHAGYLTKDEYVSFSQPYSRRIFEFLHQAGIPTIHYGRKTKNFLTEFSSITDGAVGLDHDIRLSEAYRILGAKRSLQGNLDPAFLCKDFQELKREVDQILRDVSYREGYIFNVSHALLPETPLDTIIRLGEYIHEK